MDYWPYALLAFFSFLNAMVAVTAKRTAQSLQRRVRELEAIAHPPAHPESHQHPELIRLPIVQSHLETLFQDSARFRNHLLQHHPPRVLFFHPPSWLWMRKKTADGRKWIDPLKP